jgi:hypothetical protein
MVTDQSALFTIYLTSYYSSMHYCFLPPYSPDYQPIKEMFHQLKQWIHRNYREGWAAMDCVLGPTHPYTFLFEGLDSISANNIQGFFRDTGYAI